ncbi:MAG: transketolase [Bacteroidetes bacterium]|nr:transketolase [Bacteroidota bacterium]
MDYQQQSIDELSINTIRFLAVDAIQKANSGHPGMPMGCAPIGYLLYSKLMKHNPANSKWWNRDRFVLSAGHGSTLLYSLLHLSGYQVSLDDLKKFRQWGSITPGHPEFGLTDGVETTTGPLGQGFANAVGMSVAAKHMAAKFNRKKFNLFNHHIYAIAGDGDIMEGITHEAASFAGHNKLGNLIVFYDNNGITIEGSVSITMSEDVAKRFEAYGWHVQHIKDVNDLKALEESVVNAQNEKGKPSIIITDTHIGYGSPNKQDTSHIHGSPLGQDEVVATKKNLGCPEDKTFYIPEDVTANFSKVKTKGASIEFEWNKLFEEYKTKFPQEVKLLIQMMSGEIGEEWKTKLPKFERWDEKIATRSASSKVLNSIAEFIPNLIGGSADLEPSTNTEMKKFEYFSSTNFDGRNFHFGIREHSMAAILNGIAYYGGFIPYGATFLVFSDYLRPALRIASISHISPIYVFTHDSIGLGEDGPTHQPVEHFAALRSIPGMVLIRPADANETSYAWQAAIEHKGSPVALALTRQKLSLIDRTKYASAENLLKGAYIIKDCGGTPDIILMASGSEVEMTIQAGEELEEKNIKARVVSFPSWELFEKQSDEYKESVLPKSVKARVSVEAGVKFGWEKYTGSDGACISIEKYGASAPYEILFLKYGFTVENIVEYALKLL